MKMTKVWVLIGTLSFSQILWSEQRDLDQSNSEYDKDGSLTQYRNWPKELGKKAKKQIEEIKKQRKEAKKQRKEAKKLEEEKRKFMEEKEKLNRKYGSDLNKIRDGFSPLHRALIRGEIEMAKLLIKHGADVNSKSGNDETPLQIAQLFGLKEMQLLLVGAGADVHVRNKDGETPLQIAQKFGQKEMQKLFIENGAEVNISNQYGETPLHIAIHSVGDEMPLEDDKRGHKELVKQLEELLRREDVNTQIAQRMKEISDVYYAERNAVIREKHTAYIMKRNGKDFHTVPRELARKKIKPKEIVELLIKNRADVNVKNKYGQTPLYNAILLKKWNLVVPLSEGYDFENNKETLELLQKNMDEFLQFIKKMDLNSQVYPLLKKLRIPAIHLIKETDDNKDSGFFQNSFDDEVKKSSSSVDK